MVTLYYCIFQSCKAIILFRHNWNPDFIFTIKPYVEVDEYTGTFILDKKIPWVDDRNLIFYIYNFIFIESDERCRAQQLQLFFSKQPSQQIPM